MSTKDTDTETSGESKSDSESTGKTFTQKELDAIIDRRLKKQEAKFTKLLESTKGDAIAEWREEQGLDDEVLEKLGEGRGVEDQLKSEIRKLKTEATKAKNSLESMSEKYSKLMSSNKEAQINDALLREAAGKFVNPQHAVALLKDRFVYDESEHAVFISDEKGEPSALTVKELVEGLLESDPHLALPKGLPGAGSRVSPSTTVTDTKRVAMTKEQRIKLLEGL